MSQITVTWTVTDSAGTKFTGTTVANSDAITATAVITPDPAPAGTQRTLTIAAQSSTGLALTFGTPTAQGITFTPVVGQPNQFTFTL